MKKYVFAVFAVILIAIFAAPMQVQARSGRYMGFFGGISEGRRLPGTTETIIQAQGATRPNRNNATVLEYRELVFLGGRPELFEGTLEIRSGAPAPDSTSGTFVIEHRVRPRAGAGGVSITRDMFFTVTYRRPPNSNQILYTYEVTTWRDTINVPGAGTFTLDRNRSNFVVSVIEDQTPGVNYYRGNISARIFYSGGTNGETMVEKHGTFTGFNSAWSATETHIMNVSVVNDNWVVDYQIRPSVTVNKVLQFVRNTPTVISFEGNFMELHQSFAGLRYDIFIAPQFMWDEPRSGSESLTTFNVFEQLFAPDLAFLRGHPAEDDIHRLFAMEVLTGDPRHFDPSQAITRGQFMTALARALKLPVQEVVLPRATRGNQPEPVLLFSDVSTDRPEFRYIQAIVNSGVAQGRQGGSFDFDEAISRQEAIVTIVRALGLLDMWPSPTVVLPFADSDRVGNWAMRGIGVAWSLGIIQPDVNGNLHPTRAVSNAEAASLLNHMIDYLREGIVRDYADQLVNIVHQ